MGTDRSSRAATDPIRGRDALSAFASWCREWAGLDSRLAAGDDVRLGVTLARARREALAALMVRDPRSALAAAIPWSQRRALPAVVQAELEEVVHARGRLDVWCAWDHPAARMGSPVADPWRRVFTAGGREYRAFVYGRRLAQATAEDVVIRGIAVGDRLAVHEDSARVMEEDEVREREAVGELGLDGVCDLTGVSLAGGERVVMQHGGIFLEVAGLAAAGEMSRRLASVEPGFRRSTAPPTFGQWSHGVKRVLFMRARFPDDLREPVTEAEAADVMREANAFLVRSSFNSLSLITTVGPLVTLPQPKLYYAAKGPAALLRDAREATRLAGVESSVFDLDLVRFENVPGFDWAGLASVGGRGLWLQSSALGVVCHELGHNLGLGHANFWDTVRPAPPDPDQGLPFDADGLVGMDSVIGPGDDVEYGDPFDVMGSGGGPTAHFHGLHKHLLGWIPDAGVQGVSADGEYRVHAHDVGVLAGPGRPHVLRIRRDAERSYWVSVRGEPGDNPWLARGVELHWNNWHQAIGTAQLLDTTPGSGHGKDDAALGLGRTFVDEAAQIYITPLRRVVEVLGGVRVPVVDVAVRFGPFPTNHDPELQLEASAVEVGVGQSVVFQATATDEDGDGVAVSWEFGQGEPGPPEWTVTRSWSVPGDYVVRCEVSDLRGGRASRHLVVRVGPVRTLRITGTVMDGGGRPLAGVRMHNGRYGTNSPYAPEYRWTTTDSEGRYTLTGLEAGDYEVGGVLAGYVTRPLNFARPLVLNRFTGVGVDFFAAPLPRVSVRTVQNGDDGTPRPAVFEIARTGSLADPLRVYFRNAGTAQADEDYTPWAGVETQTNTIETVLQPVVQAIPFHYVDLPSGMASTNLSFAVTRDAVDEGGETLALTLQYPVSRTVASETETNSFDIPGWEVQSDNGRETWQQTRPFYHLGARDEAVAVIRDGGLPAETTVSIVALERGTSENLGDSASFLVTRTGRVPTEPLRVSLEASGTATPDDDYVAVAPFVVLPVGVDAVRVRVAVLEDRYVEGNESVTVRLAAGVGYRVGNASATVLIVDNDLPLVTVTGTEPVVSEAGLGARVTVQRSGDLSLPLEVDYLVGGSALPGADYVPLPGRVTVPAGESAVAVTVVPINDREIEGDETVEITVGDSPVYNAAAPSRAVVVVRDDEFPSVSVQAVDDEATEGTDDPGVFRIRRAGVVDRPLEVRYRFGGDAIHQADFVASGDRVVIPAGQTEVVLTVIPIDDSIREDAETIALELLPDQAYTLGTPTGAGVRLLDGGDTTLAVGFALLHSRVSEMRTNPEIAVRVTSNPEEGADRAVTVAWEVLGGTATSGGDYVLTHGTLVFEYADPEGDEPLLNRVQTIPLEVIDDLLPEPDESLVVRLRIAPTVIPSEDTNQPPQMFTNGVMDVFTVHTLTIVDDDRSDVRVRAVRGTTMEGSGEPATFVVERFGQTNTAQSVVVHYSGLASPGSDYPALPTTLAFAPGQASLELAIHAIDDPVMEYRENVVLTLVDAPGSRVSTMSQAEVAIDDNDGTVEFALARYEAREGDGMARIAIRRVGDTRQAMSARFEALAGTAVPAFLSNGVWIGDFLPTNRLVAFGPGESVQEVEVALVDDLVPDGQATVRLALSRGSSLFPLGGQNMADLVLLDDDGWLSTGTNQVAAVETDAALRVIVVRNGSTAEPLVADYETVDLSALSGVDYEPASGRVEFEPGVSQVEIPVRLRNDPVIEGDEVFLVRLRTPEGEPIGEIQATIVDDDCAVEFAAAEVDVDEDAGTLDVMVTRVGSPLRSVAVEVFTVPGTAADGEDFEPTLTTLMFLGSRFETLTNGTGGVEFRPGQTSQVVSVRIVNDSEGERDEQFRLALGVPRSGIPGPSIPFVTTGSVTSLLVNLRDNEAPGRVDDAFQPGLGADAPVRVLGLQADGKVLVGGEFATFDGVVVPRLVRLHADGLVDRSFNPGRGFDGMVLAVAEVSDGRILAGGSFTNLDGVERPYLARLEPDGTRADGFERRPDGWVRAIARGDGARVFVGGDFTAIDGRPLPGVARLVGEGEIDGAFRPSGGDARSVRALLSAADGGVWVGGAFANWAGAGARHLVKLNAEGAPDPAASLAGLDLDGPVNVLARAPDGSVYVGGEFTRAGGLARAGVVRLVGAAVDPGFDPGPGAAGAVLAVGLHGGDRPLVAGTFERFGDLAVGRFARLEAGGGVDAAFFRGAGANDVIRAVAVQPDGAFILGGDFTEVNQRPRMRVARIHADEKFAEGFVEFAAPLFRAGEGDADAEIVVRRSGSAKAGARMGYVVSGLTAMAGEDFDAVAGELVFEPGQTNRSFRVRLRDDALAEGSETATLALTNVMGAFPGRWAVARLVIDDDEAAVAFELPSVSVGETNTEVVLAVRRSGPLEGPARVRYRAEDETAVGGEDFDAVSGVAEFASGAETAMVRVPLRDDVRIEGDEEFRVVLEPLEGGLSVGSQATVRVTLSDDDRPPTHHTLTVEVRPGGAVVPAGGRFPTNTTVLVRALPDRGFEFARWEGTVVSADNPLALAMDRNHVLAARFRPREYLETFESGGLGALPWTTTGSAPWVVTSETASSGRHSVRSGVTTNGGSSVLVLERETPAGGASFDFRTATENGWDHLEFLLNGVRVERWSGVNGWQTFAFNVPAGRNRFEWRFRRDATFSGAEDTVWLDNLDLPDAVLPPMAPRIAWVGGGAGGCRVRVESEPGRDYVLEASADLRTWQTVGQGTGVAGGLILEDPGCGLGTAGARFYRVRAE